MVVAVVVVVSEVVVLLFFSECQAEALLVPAPTPGNLIATDSFSTSYLLQPSPSLLLYRFLLTRRRVACLIARLNVFGVAVLFFDCDSLRTRLRAG